VRENVQVWDAHPVSSDQSDLGEGARWCAERSELISVDLTAGVCRFSRYRDGLLTTTQEIQVDGFLALVEPLSNGGYVACRERTVEWWDSSLEKIMESEIPLGPNERLNDGSMNPDGQLVVGSMGMNGEAGLGKLWLVELGREPLLLRSGDGIPNGIAWDVSRNRVYWVDSGPGVVYVFNYLSHGVDWSAPIETWEISDQTSTPDGLSLDSSGNIWIAMWGGSRVDGYSPDGKLIGRVKVPASQTTSCAFGGEGLRNLFITSAAFALSADQLAQEPEAGLIFVATMGEPPQEAPHG
jgi:sugar lactone lactonase YvrE